MAAPFGLGAAGTGFSLCMANPMVIQADLFGEWLRGHGDGDALEAFAARRNLERCPELQALVQSQFRAFELLEQHLQRPRFFIDQCLFPLPLEIKRTLLEHYYSFDQAIARELLDKKMSSRGRRDLDEICAQTGQPLASIRRQFESIKRVQRRVEELPGDLHSNIQRKFLLSKSLSAQYATLALLNKHRIEIGRRKVALSTPAVFECAEALFFNLTLPAKTSEFDYLLAREIRELRTAGFGGSVEDLIDALVEGLFAVAGDNTDLVDCILARLEPHDYRLLHRLVDSTLQLGSGLSQAKEVRDLVIDMHDTFARPLLAAGFQRPEIETLFEALARILQVHPTHDDTAAWRRLVASIKISVLAIVTHPLPSDSALGAC